MIGTTASHRTIAGVVAGVAVLAAVATSVMSIRDDERPALPIAEATTLIDQFGTIRIFADLRVARDTGCGATKNLTLKVTEKSDRIVLRLMRAPAKADPRFLVTCEKASSPGIVLGAVVGARPVVDASDGSTVSVTQVDRPIEIPIS